MVIKIQHENSHKQHKYIQSIIYIKYIYDFDFNTMQQPNLYQSQNIF